MRRWPCSLRCTPPRYIFTSKGLRMCRRWMYFFLPIELLLFCMLLADATTRVALTVFLSLAPKRLRIGTKKSSSHAIDGRRTQEMVYLSTLHRQCASSCSMIFFLWYLYFSFFPKNVLLREKKMVITEWLQRTQSGYVPLWFEFDDEWLSMIERVGLSLRTNRGVSRVVQHVSWLVVRRCGSQR